MKTLAILTIFLLALSSHEQCTEYYTAQSGDTCDSIAAQYFLPGDNVISLNPDLDCNNLQDGQEVCLAEASVEEEQNGNTLPSNCVEAYTAVSGDNCTSLTLAFTIPTEVILSLNPGIDCNNLQAGQQLCFAVSLAETEISGTTEEEQNGGSSEEEQNTGVPEEENNGGNIEEEQNGGTSEEENNGSSSEEEQNGGNVVSSCVYYYTVVSGDTCTSITSAFSISTEDFTNANPGVDCGNLQTGQQLCVVVGYHEESEVNGNNGEEQTGGSSEEEQNTGVSEEENNGNNSEEEQNGSSSEEESQPSNEEEEEASLIFRGPFDSVAVEIPQNPNPAWSQENLPLNATRKAAAPTSGVDLFAQEIIYAHQVYRDKYNLPQFTYSYHLANDATTWAKHLAENHLFKHSASGPYYGESLAGAYVGVSNISYYVDLWGAEEVNFIPDCTFPDCSTTGSWLQVGHYTQIIWRNTQSVGCGYWTVDGLTTFCCHYYPPGNYLTQKVY